MNNIHKLQQWLHNAKFDGFLVPSTDEYLSEFAPPFARRLAWSTGFKGSTGFAAITPSRAVVFADTRYKAQAQRECGEGGIEVLDAGEQLRFNWLARNLKTGDRLAVDTTLHSHVEVESLRALVEREKFELIELLRNPIDEIWIDGRPEEPTSRVFDYPVHFAGASREEKSAAVRQAMAKAGIDLLLLGDPEDVAWLLNVRTDEESNTAAVDGWQIVPICLSRVLLHASGEIQWFVNRKRLDLQLSDHLGGSIKILQPPEFVATLSATSAGKTVGANLHRTPYRFTSIVRKVGRLKEDVSVMRMRWQKHPNEIARAKEGHVRDGKALTEFMAWLNRSISKQTITELEAAQKLAEIRAHSTEYKGISMPLMSASGRSGALPHYVPSPLTNRSLNDHPIYWMDSGAQYYGCTTDNTICLAVGKPEPRHVRAHTLVVKGLISLSRARVPVGTSSSQIDTFARQFLWNAGMDYGHGTGHGVGNFMNIHEGPYIRKDSSHPLVAALQIGMIVANEPAYYQAEDFGIRVETHLLTIASPYDGFLEFETLSRFPFDPKLMDWPLLTVEELEWLAQYHEAIGKEYEGVFDTDTADWLGKVVEIYRTALVNSTRNGAASNWRTRS